METSLSFKEHNSSNLPVPVAARLLRLRVRIPPGAVGVVFFQVEVSDHSSRGVLPTVVRRCVGSRNLVNEEVLVHWGLLRQKQTKLY